VGAINTSPRAAIYPPSGNIVSGLRLPVGRTVMILASMGYVASFHLAYVGWIAPYFSDVGLPYAPPGPMALVLLYVLALLPSSWVPIELERPTQFVYLILYLAVYVPSIFVPTFVALQPMGETLIIAVVLCVGMGLIGSSYKLTLLKFRPSRIEPGVFWTAVIGFTLALDIWVIIKFGSSLRFVSFEDVYSVRHSSSGILSQAGFLSYAIFWLSGALNPYLIASGFFEKKTYRMLLGIGGQVLIYAAAAHKAALLSIVFIPAFALFLRRNPRRVGIKVAVVGVAVLLVLTFLLQLYPQNDQIKWVGFVVLFRALAMPGLSTAEYQDFFSRNPHTWFTQYRPFIHTFGYPYSRELGLEIGKYYSKMEDTQANAHFWASDGIASAGVVGILMASVLCGLVFWVVDTIFAKYPTAFGAATLSFWALAISNVSLLTSISSNGLGILIVLIYFGPQLSVYRSGCAGEGKRQQTVSVLRRRSQ
jgi:hypothetical protein